MTTESNDYENHLVDQLSNQWLDTEPGDSGVHESAMDTSESLNSEQLHRAADFQLLHAMLMGLAGGSEDVEQHRVDKLMQSIRADKKKGAGEGAMRPQKSRRYVVPAIRWLFH